MYDSIGKVAAQELAKRVDTVRFPPLLTLILPDRAVQAALLVWGRLPSGVWIGGVAYLHRTWHDRALVTMWVPAERLKPHPSHDYRQVPRVGLAPDPAEWPELPARYPHAGHEWTTVHRHTVFAR